MTIAHAIGRAWLSAGGPAGLSTGSQNYDEFADEAEITAIIAANPMSALGVEMPHRAPDSLGQTLEASLPAAAERLAAAKDAGRYVPYDDLAVVYRITSPGGTESLIEHRSSIEGDASTTPKDLLRLSVGLEDAADLYDDLAAALDTGHRN